MAQTDLWDYTLFQYEGQHPDITELWISAHKESWLLQLCLGGYVDAIRHLLRLERYSLWTHRTLIVLVGERFGNLELFEAGWDDQAVFEFTDCLRIYQFVLRQRRTVTDSRRLYVNALRMLL